MIPDNPGKFTLDKVESTTPELDMTRDLKFVHVDQQPQPGTSRGIMQDWTQHIPIRMQALLLAGMRGPDCYTRFVIRAVRWFRAQCCTIKPRDGVLDINGMIVQELPKECKHLPVHLVRHLAEAMLVVAYMHPVVETRDIAFKFAMNIYTDCFHVDPPLKGDFMFEHRDLVVDRLG
jgi:hypothetical protein